MPAKARHRRWSPTLTRSGTALLALAVPLGVAFALPSPTPPRTAAVASDGTLLLDETFTGATAQAGFIATSDACLTGAAQVTGPLGPGPRPLGGCPGGATGPVPPNAAAPYGYLRLTDAGNDRSAAVLYDSPLPANGGLELTFEQWQYGGTTNPSPADGIAMFLVDGAASLTHPGAFGGSLGYAQKLPDDNPANPFLPGVDGGYLGVGLDVLGNYFGDWEHRGNGCATRSPAGTAFRVPAPGANMVTVRGPGQGTDGYCWLAATTDNTSTTGPWNSTLPGTLQGPTTAADLPPTLTPAEAEAALVPSRRTVTVRVTPTPDPQVTVDVDFGSGAQRVLAMAAPQPVPATYKFGFAASTGLFTDVHLIRHVTAHSLVALPRLNLVKQIDRSTPLPDPVVAGTAVPYEFVVTNAGNVPVDNLAVTDPTVGAVTCPVATLAVGATTTCHGTYTVTAADVQRGYVANTAVAHGTADGDRVESPESKVTLPLDDTYGLLLTKHVDDSKHYAVGDHATYTYTVTNTTDAQVTDLAVHDDRLTGITCEATTLTPRETPGAVTTCTGTYVVTEADAATGHIGNTAYATGTTPNRDVSSPPDSANIVVAGPSPSPSPTPTHTHTYTPRPTPTHTHRPRPTPTPTPTETCTPAATPTPTETHSPEPTHTYTHGPKPTPTHTYTHGPKPTPTHTRSVKPTPTPTRTCAPGPTPTAGPTATSSPCPESTGPHPTYPTRPPRTAYPVAPGGPGPGSGPAVADRIPTTGSGPAAQLVGLAAVLLIVGGVLMELTRKRRSRRSRP